MKMTKGNKFVENLKKFEDLVIKNAIYKRLSNLVSRYAKHDEELDAFVNNMWDENLEEMGEARQIVEKLYNFEMTVAERIVEE